QRAYIGGTQAAAGHHLATRSVQRSHLLGSSHRRFKVKRKDPMTWLAVPLGRSTASTRLAARRKVLRGSIRAYSRELSAWSLDGACEGKAGRIPSLNVRRALSAFR